MRVLIIHPKFTERGGAERKILLIANKLVELGHYVHIVTFELNKAKTFNELITDHINITTLKKWKGFIPKLVIFISIMRIILNTKYDAHIASNYPANLFINIRTKNRIWICNEVALLIFERKKVLWAIYLKLEIYINTFFKIVIVNSQNTYDKFTQRYKVKTKIVYPGLDTKYLDNLPQLKRKEKNLYKYFLVLGRIEKHKNIDFILEIAQNLPKNINLVVAGTGAYKEKIMQLSSKYQNVLFLGEVTEIEKKSLYIDCLAYLFLPIDEPFGVTVIEALYFGCNVIAFNVGGPKEIINNKFLGRLCEDRKEYLLEIEKFNYPNEESSYIKEYRKSYIKEKFSLDKMLVNIIQEIMIN